MLLRLMLLCCAKLSVALPDPAWQKPADKCCSSWAAQYWSGLLAELAQPGDKGSLGQGSVLELWRHLQGLTAQGLTVGCTNRCARCPDAGFLTSSGHTPDPSCTARGRGWGREVSGGDREYHGLLLLSALTSCLSTVLLFLLHFSPFLFLNTLTCTINPVSSLSCWLRRSCGAAKLGTRGSGASAHSETLDYAQNRMVFKVPSNPSHSVILYLGKSDGLRLGLPPWVSNGPIYTGSGSTAGQRCPHVPTPVELRFCLQKKAPWEGTLELLSSRPFSPSPPLGLQAVPWGTLTRSLSPQERRPSLPASPTWTPRLARHQGAQDGWASPVSVPELEQGPPRSPPWSERSLSPQRQDAEPRASRQMQARLARNIINAARRKSSSPKPPGPDGSRPFTPPAVGPPGLPQGCKAAAPQRARSVPAVPGSPSPSHRSPLTEGPCASPGVSRATWAEGRRLLLPPSPAGPSPTPKSPLPSPVVGARSPAKRYSSRSPTDSDVSIDSEDSGTKSPGIHSFNLCPRGWSGSLRLKAGGLPSGAHCTS